MLRDIINCVCDIFIKYNTKQQTNEGAIISSNKH